MLAQTLQLVRRAFGRDATAQLQRSQDAQRRDVDTILRADFHAGNFDCPRGHLDDDSIPSDAFGDW